MVAHKVNQPWAALPEQHQHKAAKSLAFLSYCAQAVVRGKNRENGAQFRHPTRKQHVAPGKKQKGASVRNEIKFTMCCFKYHRC